LGLVLGAVGAAQEPAAAPPTENQGLQAHSSRTLLDLLQKGGPVMYPLYACTILMVAFGIERAVSLRRKKVISPAVDQCLQAAAGAADPAACRSLLADLQADDSPMGRIIRAGVRRADCPPLELEKTIEDAGAKEAARLQRNNRVLSSVATLAPLLGLLGTVTGFIRSFMVVATSSEALGRAELLAAGIYESLVTTAVGLSVAIPAMALYFYYQERVDTLVGDMDQAASDLLERLTAKSKPGEGR